MTMVPGATTVNIAGFVFAPGGLTVAPGKAITWINTDESPHQITVQGTDLKTGFLLKGQQATLTFPAEGVFSYNCALHPNMKGSVEVKK
jgi:plastocyanin